MTTSPNPNDSLAGQRYGEWVVISFAGHNPRRQILVTCQCSCGNAKTVTLDSIKRGLSTSCGRCNTITQDEMSMLCRIRDGRVFRFDVADLELVKSRTWHINRYGYVVGKADRQDQQLSRLILRAPDGQYADHINGDTLDNRRCNLRLATRSQNQCNRGVQSNNRSGYKGVRTTPRGYVASIGFDRKVKRIGLFSTPEEAARAYDAEAKKQHGEFARLNFEEVKEYEDTRYRY